MSMSKVETAKFVKAARVGEILPGQSKLVEIDDVRIALFNLEGEYYAISTRRVPRTPSAMRL